MLEKLRKNIVPLSYAVLVHVLLIALLIVGLDWTPTVDPQAAGKVDVVQATVVDEAKIQAEIRRNKQTEDKKRQQEKDRQKELDEQAEQARQASKEEAARLEKLKQEKVALEQTRQEQEQRLTELKKQTEQEKRLAEQQRQDEAKRSAEAEAEAKRKVAAEKKQQDEAEAKQRREAEEQLKRQLAAEEQLAAAAVRENEVRSLLSQYAALIQQKVERSWLRPPGAREGMTCTVRVRLIPGGEVTDARVIVSSGDAVFDRSVENAVHKASPLPLPADPEVLEYLNREIDFVFKPS